MESDTMQVTPPGDWPPGTIAARTLSDECSLKIQRYLRSDRSDPTDLEEAECLLHAVATLRRR